MKFTQAFLISAAAIALGSQSAQASGRSGRLRRTISRLRERIAELEAVDPNAGAFECPVNSFPDAARITSKGLGESPESFEDCVCESTYFRDGDFDRCVTELKIRVNNLSFQQPFGQFLVMVHNATTPRLYAQGQPASPELARLAEDGNPQPLVEFYGAQPGVLSVTAASGIAPMGQTVFTVRVNDDYPQVTLGSMAINTNDCFVSLNGVEIDRGFRSDFPGLDAGSEENNEECTSIPGPACLPESGNVESGNGEGAVHVHRGFFGINEGKNFSNPLDNGVSGMPLTAVGYDWRNPMMRVAVL